MKRHLLTILLFIVPFAALAGSADAVIRGQTESGRTKLEVKVSDIEGPVTFVKLTIDGESYTVSGDELSESTVIRDRNNSIYVIILRSERIVFRLWMIPKSEKIVEESNGTYRSRFGAVIEATDPRKSKSGDLAPRITIGCTLDWSI